MVTNTVTTTLCDKCGKEIDLNDKYIDAGVYGVELHLECFNNLSARELVVILSLDDTYVSNMGSLDRGIKANIYFRQRIREDLNDAYARLG